MSTTKTKNEYAVDSSNVWGKGISKTTPGHLSPNNEMSLFSEMLSGAMMIVGLISVVCFSLVEVFIPLSASAGYKFLMFLRILEGLAQGVTMSLSYCLIGRWALASDVSRFSALVYSGCQIGTVLGQVIAGVLSQTRERLDPGSQPYYVSYWPVVHYVFGGLGLLLAVFWMFTVYDSPDTHPRISMDELRCLQSNTKNSRSVCQNGFLSSVPYITEWFVCQIAAFITDTLGGAGAGSLAVGLLGCNRVGAVILLTITISLMGFGSSGYVSNMVDIAPAYSGNIMSFSNTISTLPGILGPPLVGVLTKESSSVENWMIVFGISAAIAWFGAIVNLLLTDSTQQLWGKLIIDEGESNIGTWTSSLDNQDTNVKA
ncbi:unnamed protein product [Calicophoron daubneyi]|uniref:Major facilitator superfamily (MFS) profile domain-containing protein n=1 Tax=Calicophoron daubneyi TaxID=300641 RepID=A0AAV2TBG1_CALDB